MSKSFSSIKELQVDLPLTWSDRVFLTFDIDWASDEVLNYTIDIVEKADVSATWFVTHETPVLLRIRENPKFELGIHPNFNFLLNGDNRAGSNFDEVIERTLRIVPDAVSVRSHSMTQNSNILQSFVNKGLRYDCNHFVPYQSAIGLKPWRLWNGLIKVPYFWEDDLSLIYGDNIQIKNIVSNENLKVFDFHPIHVFLNTENITRYERTRELHHNYAELIAHRFDGRGTKFFLEQILNVRI